VTDAAAPGSSTGDRHQALFIGREQQLRTLAGTVGDAAAGRGSLALVAGEPGIGKTRLVSEVTSRVAVPVLWANCWNGPGVPAFWPWLQLLQALPPGSGAAAVLGRWSVHGDARLPRGAAVLDPEGDGDLDEDLGAAARFELFQSIADVFAERSARQPLVLVLDDLHWADEPSILLLRFLAHDLSKRRLAIIGTYRDTELHETHPLGRGLADLVRAGPHLSLAGLTEAEVGELVESLASGPAVRGDHGGRGDLGDLHRRTAGNPFFVQEVVRLLEDEPRPARQGAGDTAAAVPASVDAVVERRLGRLSADARATLTAASVLGSDFDMDTLATMTGQPDDASRWLQEAIRARLVIPLDPSGGRFAFAHALVRDCLVQHNDVAQRIVLHRRAAQAIEAQGNEDRLPELAHHLLESAQRGDGGPAAACAVQVADRRLDLLAYEDAASWYERALAVLRTKGTESGTVEECDILLRLGAAHHAAGDRPQARAAYEQAAQLARRRTDRQRLANAALGVGADLGGFEVQLLDPAQVDLLEEALEAIGPDASSLRIRLLARLAVALSFLEADVRRRELSAQAVAMARDLGDPRALGYALAAHCDANPGPDAIQERLAAAHEVLRIAGDVGDRRLELLARRFLVVGLLEVGDVAGADVHIEAFALVAEQLRQPLYRWYVPLWRGTRALMRGDIDAADRGAAEAGRIGAAAHSHNVVVDAFTLWWMCRRYDGRSAEAGQAMHDLASRYVGAPPLGADRWAVAAVMAGDTLRARGMLHEWQATGLHRRQQDGEWLPESAQVAEAAIVLDNRAVAEAIYEQLRPFAHLYCVEGDAAGFTGSVAWYLAMLARYLGHQADADAYTAQADAAHRLVGLVGDPPPLADEFPGRTPAAGVEGGPVGAVVADEPSTSPALRAEGATWMAAYAGRTVRVRDTKGVRDLATLVARPGQEVHCLELMGGAETGHAGPALDDQARHAYERRIRDLQEDVDEARAAHDLARAERAEAELDALVQQLVEAFGLGGRARRTGSPAERARAAVTHRVRAAIRRIGEVHPELGRHLRNSIRTGTWCAYAPESPTTWTVETLP
jgi:tetratricopeptide (TPR) repeat protein